MRACVSDACSLVPIAAEPSLTQPPQTTSLQCIVGSLGTNASQLLKGKKIRGKKGLRIRRQRELREVCTEEKEIAHIKCH